jgi:hypothetical protein
MKLPSRILKLNDQLDEFDIWITPSLGEIVDTEKFKEEMHLVSSTFDTIGAATDSFSDPGSCQPDSIAETL